MTRSPRPALVFAVLILIVGTCPFSAAASLLADRAQERETLLQTAAPSSAPEATASPTSGVPTSDPLPTASRDGEAARDDGAGAREDPSQEQSPAPDANETAQPTPLGQDRAAAPQAPAVDGPIGEYWRAHSQIMGQPIGAQTPVDGGVYQRFERGVAYWSGATGAHFVTGRFLGRYGADGWQGGARGFPKTDEYVDRGVVRQDFQHGSYWDGPMPTGLYSHGIVQPAGQPNGYFCGPTAGYTVLSNLGAWQSAATGEPLSIGALAGPQYMNTVGYGYTSFNDRRFEYGMNTWLGRTTYYTLHAPSVDQVLTSVMHSYETGYPTVVDEQERRGGPHFNNHSNSTFSHIMVVDSYDSSTGAVSFVDPGYTLWGGAQSIFWYPSLSTFTRTHLQNEVINDGKQHIGIYTS